MDEKDKCRLKTLFNWNRNWFVQNVKDPAQLKIALAAFDAFFRCEKLPTVTAVDIQPITIAAHSLHRQIRETAVQMLIILGFDWRCACDVLLQLVSHSNGKIRWTAITQVPYWVSYKRDTFPQDFIRDFLRKGMKDRILKHRIFAYDGVKTFFRPDLLPEIRAALVTETVKPLLDSLTELVPILKRGFYFPHYIGPARDHLNFRVFLEDGTFADDIVPLGLPMAEMEKIAVDIRKREKEARAKSSAH